MDVAFEVDRLNRLFKLYVETLENKRVKPYRISKLKSYLENLVIAVKSEYEIVTIDSNNYGDYFSDFEKQLDSIETEKIKTIERHDYETVYALRQKEKKVLKDHLKRIGISTGVYFFHYNNRIFRA